MVFTLPVRPGVNLRHKRIDPNSQLLLFLIKKIKTGITRQLYAHFQASSRHALLFSRKKKKKNNERGKRGRKEMLSLSPNPFSFFSCFVSFSFLRVE